MFFTHFKTYKYAYLWAATITFLCGTNGNNLPHFSISSLFEIDKIAHFILFGTQTFLIAMASKKHHPTYSNLKAILPSVLIGTFFGVIIEILQATVFPNRSFDYMDMLANTIGCVVIGLILNAWFNYKKSKL